MLPRMASTDVPQRELLSVQTCAILRRGILTGRWCQRLPGERTLCRELQVSRWTLRHALASLQRERLLRIEQGRPVAILGARKGEECRAGDWKVGCILPEPLWRLRPFVGLWVDALRGLVQERGGQLVVHDGVRYYRGRSGAALADLTERSPHHAWLLVLSNRSMQRWFHQSGLPVVVAGSRFCEVPLPSVDLDYRAVARHAVGVFLGQGHRRIAWLTSHRGHAGILASERGWREALGVGEPAVELAVEYHDGSPDDIRRKLDRLLGRAAPPTALFVQQSNAWLTAFGHLAQRGCLVPRDLSVIVAEDEPYLARLVPEPARYVASPEIFARRIASLLQQLREQSPPTTDPRHLVPEFLPGHSLRAVT